MMPTAVVKLSPFLAEQIFFGVPVAAWWTWLCRSAGLDAELVLDDSDAAGRLRVDGRFLGIDPNDLADLDEHDGVLSSHPPDELVVAAGPTSRARLGRRWAGRRRLMSTEDPIAVVDLASLHAAEQAVRWRVLEAARASGVRLVDPTRTFVSPTVVLEPGCTIWPDTWLLGRTIIRTGAVVHPGCHLTDTEVGPGSVLRPYTVADNATVGNDAVVGPFAHLRPGAALGERTRVGNFVEVKNSTLGAGAKANHLAYIGDATVGAGVNFSAGAITCNYDGARKHRTLIGDGAFVGTNVSLVAPLTIGPGALVAAGSVITADVAPDALAVERSPQRAFPGTGAALLSRNREAAAAERAVTAAEPEPAAVDGVRLALAQHRADADPLDAPDPHALAAAAPAAPEQPAPPAEPCDEDPG